jgi:hypothetical protein
MNVEPDQAKDAIARTMPVQDPTPEDLQKKPLIWWLGRLSPVQIVGLILFGGSLVGVGSAAGAWLQTHRPDPNPRSISTSAPADKLRLVIDSVVLVQGQGGFAVDATMSIANVDLDSELLVRNSLLVLSALSKRDGSVLTKGIDLTRNLTLKPGEMKSVQLESVSAKPWQQMAVDTTAVPTFETHFMKFLIYAIGTVAKTGEEFWLEVEVPAPIPLSCVSACVGAFSLNVSTGKAIHERCTAIMSGTWQLECLVTEEPSS